jgi:hypothetical protein
MPNWCWNNIAIVGNPNDLDQIVAKIEEKNSFLEGLYPQNMDWNYDHWVATYGTKWSDDMTETNITRVDPNVVTFGVETAWAPPCEGLLAISRFWPRCTFGIAYSEPGMDFVGYEIYNNGADRQTEFESGITDQMFDSIEKFVSGIKNVRML